MTTLIGLIVLAFTGWIIYTDMYVNGQPAMDTLKAISGWLAAGTFLLRARNTFLTSIFKQFKEEKGG